MIRVLVVDDHAVIRDGIAAILEPQDDLLVVGEAEDGDSAVRLAVGLRPDVVLMDLRLPGTDGAGAIGYVLKDIRRDALLDAIRSAARGKAVLAPTVATKLVRQQHATQPLPLSEREREVLTLVATGATNREVAVALAVSEATVKTYLTRVFAKLGVSDRTAAVTAALAQALIVCPPTG